MSIQAYIEKHKVIAICRRVYGEDLLCLAQALCEGGVKLIEVTFDQADPHCLEKTTSSMEMLRSRLGNAICFGAGTVLTVEQVEAAHQAGGKYIISPNTDQEIIAKTKELGMVSIPGAMTPTEILAAHKYGADFVKLFPASDLGLSYKKSITAPINHVKLLATGGVTEENFESYLNAGFMGAGVSGRLCDRKLIAERNFQEITRRAQSFSKLCGLEASTY